MERYKTLVLYNSWCFLFKNNNQGATNKNDNTTVTHFLQVESKNIWIVLRIRKIRAYIP